MSDLKTSQETPITSLTGAELVRIVQSGLNGYALISTIVGLVETGAQVTQTYSATITFNLTSYAGIPEVTIDLTLTGNVTFDLTNGTDGQKILVRVRQDPTGSRIWTSGSHLRMSADITSIVLSTASSKLDYLGFRWNGTDSKADLLAINKGF